MVREYLANRNVILNTVAEMDSLDAIKDFVRQTEALTILPTWAIRRELREGTLVALPLGSKRVEQTWGFAHWRHRPLSHAEASLWNYAGARLRQLLKRQEYGRWVLKLTPSTSYGHKRPPAPGERRDGSLMMTTAAAAAGAGFHVAFLGNAAQFKGLGDVLDDGLLELLHVLLRIQKAARDGDCSRRNRAFARNPLLPRCPRVDRTAAFVGASGPWR